MRYMDLHGRGESPLPNWDRPRQDEPAHGFFVRLAGLNGQLSASALANSFGLNGRVLQPSECLDFALSFPIVSKDRLHSATPIVSKTTVTLFGETFRRRDWSIARRHFCSGCLAEDAYHRSFWDLVAFRQCPFHDYPLRCVDISGNAIPWWLPSFTHSIHGQPLGKYQRRTSSLRPTIETYLLGRLGLVQRLSIPFLDRLTTCGRALAAIEFAGELMIGGDRHHRPSSTILEKNVVLEAGFKLVRDGKEGISSVLEGLAATSGNASSRSQRSLDYIFGWAYRAAADSPDFGTAFLDVMIEIAATRGLARRARDFGRTKERLDLTDASDLSRRYGASEMQIRKIASTVGLHGACSPKSRCYYAYTDEAVLIIGRTIAGLIDRNEVARILDIPRTSLDSLVSSRLIRPFVRLGGNGREGERFRPEDVERFQAVLLERMNKIAVPPTGRLLKEVKRTSRTNPAQFVQRLMQGGLPPMGRQGDTLGSIIVPVKRTKTPPPNGNRKRGRPRGRPCLLPNGIGILDAAAALGVDDPTVAALRKLGYLKVLPQSKLLDRRGVEHFREDYCPSRYYSSVLKCHPRQAGQRLEDRGVKMIRIELNGTVGVAPVRPDTRLF